MKNQLFISFETNPTVLYPVVSGPTYNDNFNEEIDSFNIIIDNITENNKPNLKKPYQFARIINSAAGTNKITWDDDNTIFMLVDDFTENLVDITDNIYRYEIQLMNVIKIFEKIQCPNLKISHSLVNGHDTIYNYIAKYMELYSPKIKTSVDGVNWKYDYLFDWKDLDNPPFNNTVCADMQMNEPTLRQLITNLMLQVGRIPTVKYRKLKYIDFREKPSPFAMDNNSGIKDANISAASDSYVNALLVSPTQTLDADNPVIAETISFRDSDSVLLKKRENLKLETRFPIYKIKQVLLSRITGSENEGMFPVPVNEVNNATENFYPFLQSNPLGGEYTTSYWYTAPRIFVRSNGRYYIRLMFSFNATTVHKGILSDIKVHLCQKDGNKYTELRTVTYSGGQYFLTFNDSSTNSTVSLSGPQAAQELLPNSSELGEPEAPPVSSSDKRDYFMPNTWLFYARIPIGTDISDITHVWFENTYTNVEHNGNIWVEKETFHQIVTLAALTNNYTSEEDHQTDVNSSGISYGDYVKYIDSRVLSSSHNDNSHADNANEITQQSSGYWYPTDRTPLTGDLLRFASGNSVVNVTDLFVESRKRSLLDTNFKGMDNVDTLEELSKYIYGTVSYSIGSNQITGFSEVYTRTQAWWNVSYSYFENILAFIKNHPNLAESVIKYDKSLTKKIAAYMQNLGNMPQITLNATNSFLNIDTSLFGDSNTLNSNYYIYQYVFNVQYYPLNSLKVELSKVGDNDVNLKIQQLNNTESGLSDFSRFIDNAQDMANRIGNPVLVVQQTTDDITKVNKLNSIYKGKYTIFKRTIQIYEDYLQITYYGSENYVIQNYFTSIITKYRAYEYVDYNESIIRKENCTIYCLLSKEHYFDGDDFIYEPNDFNLKGLLLSAIAQDVEEDNYLVKYEIENSLNEQLESETIRNEVSILTSRNALIYNFQNYDNVSAGVQISQKTWNMFGLIDGPTTPLYLGGVIQKWQMWDQGNYNVSHLIAFTTAIEFIGSYLDYVSSICKFPVVDSNWEWEDYVVFMFCDDKTKYPSRTYYKDNAEIINQTVEFYYYSDSEDIVWSENFTRLSKLASMDSKNKKIVTSGKEFAAINGPYSLSSKERTIIGGTISDWVRIGKDSVGTYLLVRWSSIEQSSFVVTLIDNEDNTKSLGDIIGFRRTGEKVDEKYYLTLNDTKTHNAWYFKEEDDLFRTLPCLNGTNRKLLFNPSVNFEYSAQLVEEDYDNAYELTVVNSNPFSVTLYLKYSQSKEVQYSMGAGQTLVLERVDLNNELDNSVLSHEIHAQMDNVYCYFKSEDGRETDNVIILEANA